MQIVRPDDIHDMLTAWGDVVRAHSDSTPEGWGWPGKSIFYRIQREGGGAGSGGPSPLTMPEAAVDQLKTSGGRAETISRLIRMLPWVTGIVVCLKYIERLDRQEIAIQTGASAQEVRRHIESAERLLCAAINAMRMAA